MIRVNPHYSKIQANYLFAEVAQRVKNYLAAHPGADLIRLGIGDVTHALPAVCVEAMVRAAREQGSDETFHGYGPDYGYEFSGWSDGVKTATRTDTAINNRISVTAVSVAVRSSA